MPFTSHGVIARKFIEIRQIFEPYIIMDTNMLLPRVRVDRETIVPSHNNRHRAGAMCEVVGGGVVWGSSVVCEGSVGAVVEREMSGAAGWGRSPVAH